MSLLNFDFCNEKWEEKSCIAIVFLELLSDFFLYQISNDGFWRQSKWVSNISLLWPEIRGFSHCCLASSMVMGPLTPLIVSPTTRQNMKRADFKKLKWKTLKNIFCSLFHVSVCIRTKSCVSKYLRGFLFENIWVKLNNYFKSCRQLEFTISELHVIVQHMYVSSYMKKYEKIFH